MNRYPDIASLTQEVLTSIKSEAPEQVKTAGESADEVKTDIGNALKEAASLIAQAKDEVTHQDIANVMYQNKQANTPAPGLPPLPIPNASAPGGVQQQISGIEAPNPAMTGKTASELGNEIRKLACSLRKEATTSSEERRTKAAHMLNAAVALRYITTGA